MTSLAVTSSILKTSEKIWGTSPISPAKFHLWEILKALARPDCPSMQTDIKNFYKKLLDNKNLKQKSIVKVQRTGTPKILFFQNHQIKRLGLMVKLPWNTKNRSQSFKFILLGTYCLQMLSLQTSKWPRSKNSKMQWSAFTFRFSKRNLWKINKKCTWKNFWFRKAAPLFWTKAWWFIRGAAS